MADNVEYIDVRPSMAYHGTGMIPEGDYDIADAKWAMWDYNGKQPTAVPALGIEYKTGDQSFVQWYSAGDIRNMKPSADGKRLEKAGTNGFLNDQTNAYQFLTALARAGFDEQRMGDISSLVGLKVTVVHEPTKEREIGGQKKQAGTMAVVGKILHDPSEKETKTKLKAVAKVKTNGADTDAGIGPKTAQVLITVLKGAENHTLNKKALSSALFSKIPGNDPDRPKMLNLIIQDAYLGSLSDQGVLYDVGSAQIMYVGE